MLDTSTSLTQVTPIPAGMSREKAIALVQDAEHHIRCDSDMKTYVARNPETPPKLPDDIHPTQATKCYSVTDSVPSLFGHRDAVSYNEYTCTKDGIFVHTVAPLGITLDTRWQIRDAQDGGLEMVAVVEILCSRLMIGMVKKQCQKNTPGFHQRLLNGHGDYV